MKKRLKRATAIALVAMLFLVLVPYFASRLGSPGLRVQVFSPDSNSQSENSLPENPDPESASSLRVVSWNIAHGRGLAESNNAGGDAATRINRLDDIAELLREFDADVVVLNEVDFDTSWSNHLNQAEYLADKAGYRYRVEERNLDFRILHWTWRFGNAILSRYPIENASVVDLPPYSAWEDWLVGKKRGVQCDVSRGDQRFHVVGLHLSHRSEEIRNRSAAHVLESIRDREIPCVVLGDMNSTPPGFPLSQRTPPGKNAIETIDRSGLLHRSDSIEPVFSQLTFRSDDPKSLIDWIFASKSLDFVDHSVHPSTLSDHRPVIAVLAPVASGAGNN